MPEKKCDVGHVEMLHSRPPSLPMGDPLGKRCHPDIAERCLEMVTKSIKRADL